MKKKDHSQKEATGEDATARAPQTAAEAFEIAQSLQEGLQARLDFYSRASRSFYPETNAAYDDLIDRIAAVKTAGPKVGEPMPDFLLPDSEGNLVALETLLSEGPLVVSFNRGHWCPWCRLELRALGGIAADVARTGAQLVSIIPEIQLYAKKTKANNKLPFRLLIDLDLGFALSLGLAIFVGEAVRSLYRRSGLDLALFHGNEGWFLPVPATFVVGSDGLVKARFVDPDFRKRMEPAEIITALKALDESGA